MYELVLYYSFFHVYWIFKVKKVSESKKWNEMCVYYLQSYGAFSSRQMKCVCFRPPPFYQGSH